MSFPIFQTSTFAQLAPGETRGYAYGRGDNPTRRALEECLASVEGARYGVAFASGLAAVNPVISTLKLGDHVIAGRDLYGGSYRLFTKVFEKFGVRFSLVRRVLGEQAPGPDVFPHHPVGSVAGLRHDRPLRLPRLRRRSSQARPEIVPGQGGGVDPHGDGLRLVAGRRTGRAACSAFRRWVDGHDGGDHGSKGDEAA